VRAHPRMETLMKRILCAVAILLISSQILTARTYTYTRTVGAGQQFATINAAIADICQQSLSSTSPGCIQIYPGTYVEQINSFYPGGNNLPAHCDLIGMGTSPSDVVIQHQRRDEGDPNFTDMVSEIYAYGVNCLGDNQIQNLRVANVGNNQNSLQFQGDGTLINVIVNSCHDAVTANGHIDVSGCTISGMYRSCIYAFSTFSISNTNLNPSTRDWGGEHPAGIEAYRSGTIDHVTISANFGSSDYVPHYDTPWLAGIIAELSNANDKITVTNTNINLTLTTLTHTDRPDEIATWEAFGVVSGYRNPAPTTYYPGTVEIRDCNFSVSGTENGRGIMVADVVLRGGGIINVLGNTTLATARTTGQYAADGYEYALVNQNGTLTIDSNVVYDVNKISGTISAYIAPQPPSPEPNEPNQPIGQIQRPMTMDTMNSNDPNQSVSVTSLPWPPDLKIDNKIDFQDFAKLAANWLKTGISLTGDFDDSNSVDMIDLNYLTSNWLSQFNWPLQMSSTVIKSATVTNPVDLAFDPNGYLYVLSGNPAQVKIFDCNLTLKSTLNLSSWYFNNPQGIAIYNPTDPNTAQLLYVVDTANNRIARYKVTSGLSYALDDVYGSSGFLGGHLGIADTDFNKPQDIAIASDGTTYITDSNNNRIKVIDANGNFITKWGTGQLNRPSGICSFSDNEIFVADANNCIQRRAASTGTLLSRFGASGNDYGQFSTPVRIKHDIRSDQIVVADSKNNRIQFLQLYSTDLITSKRMVFSGLLADQSFSSPKAAITDPNLDDPNLIVYVADTGNNRVLKLRVEPDDPNNRPTAKFSQFTSALDANDLNGALACFTNDAAERYGVVLEQLQSQFPQMAADVVDLVPVSRDSATAVYDVLRYEDGQLYGYPVVFKRDQSGTWKISQF
jgi:hypothetical protein